MCHIFLSADSDFGTFRAPSCLSGHKNGVFYRFQVHTYIAKLLLTDFLRSFNDQSCSEMSKYQKGIVFLSTNA